MIGRKIINKVTENLSFIITQRQVSVIYCGYTQNLSFTSSLIL